MPAEKNNAEEEIWSTICEAVKASELPLRLDESGWYGEGIVSADDFIRITPIESHELKRYGEVSWSIKGVHLNACYSTYERFATLMDWYFEEAGLISA